MLLELSGLDEGEIEANLLGKALSFGIAGNWAQRLRSELFIRVFTFTKYGIVKGN